VHLRLGPVSLRPQHVGIHQRSPALPIPSLRTRCRPSPCDRLSRPRTATAAPPRPGLLGRRRTDPLPTWRVDKRGQPGTLPTFTAHRSTGSVPNFAPAASPRVRRRHSSWPPYRRLQPARESPTDRDRVGVHRTPAHIRQVGAGVPLERLYTLVPHVHLSVSLGRPRSSGSADPSRRCQGCSRPPRRLPGRAALSFPSLLRWTRRRSRGRTGAPCLPFGRWVSPARPPHRTCDSHRIRRSTDSLGTARLMPSRFSPMVSGCCSPASDSG